VNSFNFIVLDKVPSAFANESGNGVSSKVRVSLILTARSFEIIISLEKVSLSDFSAIVNPFVLEIVFLDVLSKACFFNRIVEMLCVGVYAIFYKFSTNLQLLCPDL